MKIKILPNLKTWFSKEVFQVVYGILLILIIPSLIVINTIYIIGKYNQNINVFLQRQALTLGRVIYAEIKPQLNNPGNWQESITNIFSQSRSLLKLEILIPQEENFIIAASSNQERVGKTFDSNYYRLAWQQPENDALATASNQLTIEEQESLEITIRPERFWLVAMPMKNLSGQKIALLSLEVSSEIVDEMTRYSRNASLYLLTLTVLIVTLFLFIATRLWDYALLYRKIKEVDQMKDEFISMASHELRTPITAIRGYLSMVIDGSLGTVSQKVKDVLKRVDTSSERLHNLVEDLLNVSRIEQGRIKVEPKPLDVSQLIQEVVEELKVQAKEKNLNLKYHQPKSKLPQINADPDRLKQILINIIGNAIKYTLKGSVEIFAEVKGKNIEIKVKDTGIGMNAEQRQHLFEKFYRVKDERTKKVTGTGLGLWIAKQLIELQQGKIFVDSIENVGTQVTIIFPILRE